MKMLMEDIKNKQFKNIYLLTGEEVYPAHAVPKETERSAGGGWRHHECSHLLRKGTDPKEIIDLAETMPFFAEHRVILIDVVDLPRMLARSWRLCGADPGEHLHHFK